ncbi:hypothetical protein GT347_20015 [Xylophilus rhododendri]|uniref:Uncharacterized protein n=1 Tax=Xylophilus rhododendri TaxID=2697032 RepID=A0A857JAQ4_9BURK|nr:hypothetical protein [Xylophilus rhododendri]QHJ00063.1 hypothetical protein GT347_20015 [Xylophilus rhododendri]
MTIRPGDEDKMRKALGVPDAMTKATGSDIDPHKASELRQRAEREEAEDKARSDSWDRDDAARPPTGS